MWTDDERTEVVQVRVYVCDEWRVGVWRCDKCGRSCQEAVVKEKVIVTRHELALQALQHSWKKQLLE